MTSAGRRRLSEYDDPFGRGIERPCHNHGDGNPNHEQNHNERIKSIRKDQGFAHDIDDLDDQPGHHRIYRDNLKYLASSDLPEE